MAKIDKMKPPELYAAILILAARYKKTPSYELGVLIQYMMGKLGSPV